MDPDTRRRSADDRRRLGDLVLVMGEDVVDAAGVEVEARAEMAQRHRRALEVPAGEALAPARGRPLQLAALAGGLPEREVGRVALVGLDLAAMAGPQGVQRVPGQGTVVGERGDREVDVAGVAHVGVAGVDQPLGEIDHVGDVLGRPREDVRREEIQEPGVGVEGGLVGVGDLGRRLVLQPGRDEHPVLAAVESLVPEMADVGDVLDLQDGDAVIQDDPPDQVRQEEGPEVADVGEAVDRRAAGVHPEARAVGRFDRLDGPRQGVPQPKRHAEIPVASVVPRLMVWFSSNFARIALTIQEERRYRDRGLAAMHRSPGGVTCEASFPVRRRALRTPNPILAACAAGFASSRSSPVSRARTTCARPASASPSPSSG